MTNYTDTKSIWVRMLSAVCGLTVYGCLQATEGLAQTFTLTQQVLQQCCSIENWGEAQTKAQAVVQTEVQAKVQTEVQAKAQTFTLAQEHDSLYTLTLTTDSTCDRWALPYPVYRMDTGDVDGDGNTDALVGVVKTTRFYPEKGRRLFIFKNYHGLIRPLWMGSKLGGKLWDFRFADGRVRSMEAMTDSVYAVADYRWSGFGLVFERFVARGIGLEEAKRVLNRVND